MLRWGFLEILFLRSWLNSWIRLLPIPELPRGPRLQHEARTGGKRARTVFLTFKLLFFPFGPFHNIPLRLEVGTSPLWHSWEIRAGTQLSCGGASFFPSPLTLTPLPSRLDGRGTASNPLIDKLINAHQFICKVY